MRARHASPLRLNRFFLSESFPTRFDATGALLDGLSQSLPPQRILSNASPSPARRTWGRVSIASSSANPFQLTGKAVVRVQGLRLNRFFLSESFPTQPGMPIHSEFVCLNRFFLSESFPTLTPAPLARRLRLSQSLLPQRILSDASVSTSAASSSGSQSLLPQRILSDPWWEGYDSRKAAMSQSLLPQRILSDLPTPVPSGLSDPRLNRFFLSESFPTDTMTTDEKHTALSQSLLPQRILSDFARCTGYSACASVSIASSSANPFRRGIGKVEGVEGM